MEKTSVWRARSRAKTTHSYTYTRSCQRCIPGPVQEMVTAARGGLHKKKLLLMMKLRTLEEQERQQQGSSGTKAAEERQKMNKTDDEKRTTTEGNRKCQRENLTPRPEGAQIKEGREKPNLQVFFGWRRSSERAWSMRSWSGKSIRRRTGAQFLPEPTRRDEDQAMKHQRAGDWTPTEVKEATEDELDPLSPRLSEEEIAPEIQLPSPPPAHFSTDSDEEEWRQRKFEEARVERGEPPAYNQGESQHNWHSFTQTSEETPGRNNLDGEVV